MTDKPTQYVRKPFFVNAIQVTADNMESIADWCGGTIFTGRDIPMSYIRVPVIRPLSDKQTTARIGDWVLSSPKGFKVYNNVAFEKGFELAEVVIGKSVEDTLDGIDEALVRIEEKLNTLP